MQHDKTPPFSPSENMGDSEGTAELNIENGPAELQNEEERLREELTLTKDQLLRALAEAENVRRRAIKEREEAAKYGVAQLARDILSIGDNLTRALQAVGENKDNLDPAVQQFITGIEMTNREFLNVLGRFQINAIDPLHQKFDPAFHQAMFEVETDEHPVGTVVQVMQVGYTLHDRLLRPALVGVAKLPADSVSG